MIRFARLATLSALLPAVALGAPVVARISPSGLAFIERQAPSLVPNHLSPDPLSVDLWSCFDGPANVEQTNTTVDLTVDDFKLSLPSPGVLRVDVTLSATASGEARLNKIYACFGQEICQDSLTLTRARAIVDFSASVDAAGKPHVALANVDLQLDPDQVDIQFSGCTPDALLTAVLNGVKDVGLKIGLWAVEQIAKNKVGPMLEDALGKFMSYQGMAAIFSFTAKLTGLDLATTGITVGGDIDITSPYPAASCLGSSVPGEPGAAPGPAPDLGAGPSTDVGVAVNLGVVQDVLYHVWRSGYLCLTPGTFTSYGIDLAPELAGFANMPGIPAGTKFSLDVTAAQAPVVSAGYANEGTLTVKVTSLGANLRAAYPDQTSGNLHLDVDLTATASVSVDPSENAVVVAIDKVSIDRMTADDHLGLTQYGFDIDRVRRVLETRILPKVLGGLGKIPVTGPVFGGILDTYVILRGVQTTPSFVTVKADLFRAPAGDVGAPTTALVAKPNGPARPGDAKIKVTGTDALVPTELLRYRATVDGKAGAPTFVNTFAVGEDGKTKTYHVLVQAMDLAGNVDPVGVQVDVLADGIAPTLTVTTQLRSVIDTARPLLAWTAADDVSPVSKISAKVEIFHQPEHPGGELQETKVSEQDLAAGTTRLELGGLEAGKQYHVVLTVFDEAGNDASSSFVFTVSESAGGGCNVGGGAGGAWLLALGLLALARRRR
ncbi:MAG TPA: hypothetical protein VKE22_11830 [Haliangiales bacterium]|nr:hypothetical protein [Haliangiales bacterium]